MAFVNEYMSEEDIKKYDIAAWDAKFLKGHHQPDWTRDRERDIYLRYIGTGREEFANRWTFCFYWGGQLFHVELDVSGGGEPRGALWASYRLLRLMLPLFEPLSESLAARKGEILADLKDALSVFREFGIYSRATTFTATFDF